MALFLFNELLSFSVHTHKQAEASERVSAYALTRCHVCALIYVMCMLDPAATMSIHYYTSNERGAENSCSRRATPFQTFQIKIRAINIMKTRPAISNNLEPFVEANAPLAE